MHEKLLFDVIKRQAGTLSKAILEMVMNAVDAKATRCDITLSTTHLIVEDDGQGITKREQIETFFECFGQPHEDSEGKTYGTFRMGRGQGFSYGVNRWRTGKFEMSVDIKSRGLDYDLTTLKESKPGCRIEVELYSPLMPSQLDETYRTIEQWVKYSPIPVLWNGKQISVGVGEEKWDHVTDEAYIKLRETGDVAIYNLGIHTMSLPNYRLGTGGVVVSKKQLRVNFARNDVQDDCEVWQKIKPFLERKAAEILVKAPALNDDGRQRLCDKLRLGDLKEWRTPKLFTAVNGRQYSFDGSFANGKRGWKVSATTKGSPLGDRLFQQGTAFILSQETLERFKVETVPELIALLRKTADKVDQGHSAVRCLDKTLYVPFSELSAGFDENCLSLDKEEWTPNELIWWQLATHVKHFIVLPSDPEGGGWPGPVRANTRQIIIGESDSCNGWTDGTTFIALGRDFLRDQDFNIDGFCNLATLLIHELCHNKPDTNSHVHGSEFYEAFHDTVRKYLGVVVSQCLVRLPNILEQANRRETKAMLRNRDQLSKLDKALVG